MQLGQKMFNMKTLQQIYRNVFQMMRIQTSINQKAILTALPLSRILMTNQSKNICEDQEKNQEKRQSTMQNAVRLKTQDNILVDEDGIQAMTKEDILIEILKECIGIPLGFQAQILVEDDEDDIVEEVRQA